MTQVLRQSTAVDVLIGPFVDSTDGVTAETALTISQADVRLSKNGQTMAQKNDNTACVHDAIGYYNCELDATDTNTVGTLVLAVAEAGALPVRHEFQVVEEAVYDRLFASSAQIYTAEISDIESSLVIVKSDIVQIYSDTTAAATSLTNIDSQVTATDAVVDSVYSDTTLLVPGVSDIESSLVIVRSDLVEIRSDTTAIEASGGGGLTVGQASQLTQLQSDAIVLTSMVSDVESSLVIVKSDLIVIDDAVSDVESSLVIVKSDLVQVYSDTTLLEASRGVIDEGTAQSATGTTLVLRAGASFADDELIGATIVITGGSAGVGQARQITDYVGSTDTATVATWTTTPTGTITYKVYATTASSSSGLSTSEQSQLAQIQSDAIVLTSMVSDVESSLVIVKSDLIVIDDAVSDVESSLVIVKSDLVQVYSDTTLLVPAVSDVKSELVILSDAISDVESSLVIVKSDLVEIRSDTTAIEAAGGGLSAGQASQLTQIQSDLVLVYSDTTAIEGAGGGLTVAQASQLAQVQSDAIVLTSMVSDVESSLVIVKSDLVVIDDAVSDVESSLVIVKSDLLQVYSDTTRIHSDIELVYSDTAKATSDLVLLDEGIIYGTAATGTLTVSDITTNLTGYADDQLIGRTITFTSGDADGEQTVISDYTATGGAIVFTAALTTAPANGDKFKIT